MEERVNNFIEQWRKIGGNDCLYQYIYDENTGNELDFGECLYDFISSQDDIKDYEFTYCGGFDSPGYDMSAYCISIIDSTGKLYSIPVLFENY